jgi:ubiquinone/menaquinone biosynthesis C-methylase UbiE
MQSARICLADLFKIWKPKNVIDIGCGVGSWLAACDELGVYSLTGTDGPWISHNRLISPRIKFFNTDFLTQLLSMAGMIWQSA